jgi:hypothetical protein
MSADLELPSSNQFHLFNNSLRAQLQLCLGSNVKVMIDWEWGPVACQILCLVSGGMLQMVPR